MREEQAIRMIRLRLLALVLALALTWYMVNPAPGRVPQVKRDEEPPDEERRLTKPPPRMSYEPGRAEADLAAAATNSFPPAAESDVEDLEWPEVIGAN